MKGRIMVDDESLPRLRTLTRFARPVAVVAALVAAAAAFVPWGESWGFTSSDYGTVNATTDTAGAMTPDAFLVVVPLVAVALVVVAQATPRRRLGNTLLSIAAIAMVVDGGIAASNLTVMADEVSVGPGLPLMIAAAALAATAAVVVMFGAGTRT